MYVCFIDSKSMALSFMKYNTYWELILTGEFLILNHLSMDYRTYLSDSHIFGHALRLAQCCCLETYKKFLGGQRRG